jgi:hypothetical protein
LKRAELSEKQSALVPLIRGIIFFGMKELPDSETYINKAIKIDPDNKKC